MKNIFSVFLILIGLGACTSSQNLAVRTVENESSVLFRPTFKLVEQADSEKGMKQLNQMFGEKLLEHGFFMDVQNPEYLVQAVKATQEFERKIAPSVNVPGSGFPGGSTLGVGGYNTGSVNSTGEVGKVIFLVQDAESLEVVWMGTGDGIVAENRQLKRKEIYLALDKMLAYLAL